jgi:hypothetical protein
MKPQSAAPDAAGSASSSKPSVADQLRAVDTSVLDKLVEIRQEETRLESFRTRASDMKGQVSDPVYRRVIDDYTKRASALEQQATPLKTKARGEYRKLHQLVSDVTRIHDQAKLEKEELEFRHAVGELDNDQLTDALSAPQGRLDQCEADLARIEACTARFVEAFGSKAALDAPEPAAPPVGRPVVSAAPKSAPPPPPVVAPPPVLPPPIDLDATAFIPPPAGAFAAAPPDATMIVTDDATRLMPVEDSSKTGPLPPVEAEGEGQTILVPMAALIAEPGTMPHTEYRLGAINYMGRAEDNQVQIMSPEVSRKHAVITAVGSGFELKDLGSQNGVNVNGVRTSTRQLVDGDKLEIAGISLVFRSPWPARSSKGATGSSKSVSAKR